MRREDESRTKCLTGPCVGLSAAQIMTGLKCSVMAAKLGNLAVEPALAPPLGMCRGAFNRLLVS
jgi:hypothetical protein